MARRPIPTRRHATPVGATPDRIRQAGGLLREGRLVAFPTETVYGLGADATQRRAVTAVYAAKGRPATNPLIIHVETLDAVHALTETNSVLEALADSFWPGPLTLVVPRKADCPVVPEACAGLPSIAIRIPAHPVALDLIRAAGRPIAGPSANPYGRTSPTTAALVAEMLGDRIDMVLDGGPCTVGVESTVLDLTRTPAVVLRHGGVPVESIRQVAAVAPDPAHVPDEPARSPGQAASHYAPRLPVRLDATEIDGDEALLAFGPAVPRGAHCVRNLSPDSSLTEAGANLFRMMHELDRSGAARIAVMKIPDHGLGRAINDRLRRAAAPRPADVR